MRQCSTALWFCANTAVCIASLIACAARVQAAVLVENAWVRATVPGQKVAAVYLDIHSDARATLIGVRSPAASTAEVHSTSNDGGVAKMRQVQRLDLPAGQTVRLAPNGNHIMLMDIKQPLQAGARVPVVLIIEQKGKKKWIQVQAEVRPVTQ